MAMVDTAVNAIHLLFAGLWAGSVVFVAGAVVPAARAGELNATPLRSMLGRFRMGSRAASLVLLLTGGHLAGTHYTAETLFGSGRGHLVLGMVVLWLVLTGLVEVASGRLADGLDERKVRAPAESSATLFAAAAVAAILLLVLGGVLL